MAKDKVQPSNGKYELGGSKDTDLEGIDSDKFDVYTETDKLANAQRDYPPPGYDWFASYTIEKKPGVNDPFPSYTLKFDKPASGNLYYYLGGQVYQVTYQDTDDKRNKKRVKATLNVADPPVGIGGK